MATDNTEVDPDWDAPVGLNVTPAAIIHALFWSADSVHTGWDSCVDHDLVVWEVSAVDDNSDNHCRLVEQEYADDEANDVTWHDWTVELKLSSTYVSAHWRAQVNANMADWEWCTSEAEKAFTGACLFVGKRIRRGLVVESSSPSPRGNRTHH
jgi:hypothetical protein